MITAKNIRRMIDLPLEDIKSIAKASRIDMDIRGAEFLGLTNGGEFCYRITHWVLGGTDSEKMFFKYNPAADRVIATIS